MKRSKVFEYHSGDHWSWYDRAYKENIVKFIDEQHPFLVRSILYNRYYRTKDNKPLYDTDTEVELNGHKDEKYIRKYLLESEEIE